MWLGIGIGVFLRVVLFIFLGVRTLRNGHGWMFFFGIFFPLLWILGALMQPVHPQAMAVPTRRLGGRGFPPVEKLGLDPDRPCQMQVFHLARPFLLPYADGAEGDLR